MKEYLDQRTKEDEDRRQGLKPPSHYHTLTDFNPIQEGYVDRANGRVVQTPTEAMQGKRCTAPTLAGPVAVAIVRGHGARSDYPY